MRERPILFSGEMVKAILEGRKTMTRRVVNKDISNQFDIDVDNTVAAYINQLTGDSCDPVEICPYGTVGDRLWVRETWQSFFPEEVTQNHQQGPRSFSGVPAETAKGHYMFFYYRADGEAPDDPKYGKAVWHPSIFMPRRASRILLEVTDVKVERLQDITEEDAEKEGMPDEYLIAPVYCPNCQGQGTCGAVHPISLGYMEIDCPECDTAKKKFKNLWDSINGRGRKPGKAWDDNPWVWVVEFRRVEEC